MTEEQLPWFLQKHSQFVYLEDNYCVLDFETSNLDKGSALTEENKVVLACWTVVKDGVPESFYKFGDEYDQYEMVKAVQAARFVVAHNAKFEAQWLKRCGVDLRSILLYDTMLGQWVLDGNLGGLVDRGLDVLCQKRGWRGKLGLVSNLIAAGVCPSTINPKWLLKYCQQDVALCHRLFLEQRQELQVREQLHLVHNRNLTCACLADIEFNGMWLDAERVEREYEKTTREWADVAKELESLSPNINWGSPKQVAAFLYDELKFSEVTDYKGKPVRTDTGNRSTGAEVMSKLVPSTERQERFLIAYKKFNRLDSLLSKNLTFFHKVCKEKGGKFYGNFNQGIAASHRLTATGKKITFSDGKSHSVQFQNLPRQYKDLFCSGEEDWLTASVDSAQLEFRVAVDLGKDEVGYKEIVDGVDVHAFTAKVMTEAGEETSRQDAKPITFKPLYGGGRGSKAVEEYCEFFKNKYKGISETQYNWTLRVLNDKQLVTPYGMIFFWPKVERRKGYITFTTEIYNYPVQGFATAEIIPIALVHFWHRTKGKPIVILNTVHDSIVAKIHPSAVEEYEQIAKQSLTTDVYRFLREVYDYNFRVPLGVGIKIGTHWDEAKVEKLWNVWPSGEETYKEK